MGWTLPRYVVTQLYEELQNEKLHPNSGAPDYDVTHLLSGLTIDQNLALGTYNLAGNLGTLEDLTLNAPVNIYALSHDNFADFLAAEHLSLPNTIAAVLSDHNLAAHTALGLFDASSDVDHDATTNFLAAEHIDWTDAASNFKTTVPSGYAGIFMGGNVGIGTATPLAKLDVSDTLGGIVTRSTSPGAAAYTVIPWETQGSYSGNLVITVNASSWAGYTYDIKVGGLGQSHHHAGAFYNNNGISAAIQSIAVGGALTVTQASQVITFTLDVTSMTNPYMTLTLGSGGGYSIKPSDVTIAIN